MKIAIVLYPGFTALDAVGPYETLNALPGWDTVFVAEHAGPFTNDQGHLTLIAQAGFDEVKDADVLVVPGGPPAAIDAQSRNPNFLMWLQQVDAATTFTTSVCMGSVLLAAAGLLKGRRATSHWLGLHQGRLDGYGATPVDDERVVTDGKYVTAAGVSAGIDMGLAIAGRLAGDDFAQIVQLMIEYAPEPPYATGSPHTAPASLVDAMRTQGFPHS